MDEVTDMLPAWLDLLLNAGKWLLAAALLSLLIIFAISQLVHG